MQAVKQAGGIVIAQDQASSKQFSMPHSAIATGSVEHVLPLPAIAHELVRLSKLPA